MRSLIKSLILKVVPYKFILVLKQLEVIARCHFSRRYYEADESMLLRLLVERGNGVAVDVGANFGQYSYAFARLPNCTNVLSIEPQQPVARMFCRMTAFLGVSKIFHIEALVSDAKGFAYMQTPNRSGCAMSQETFMVKDNKIATSGKIPVGTIDDFVIQHVGNETPVMVIKIDVEGAELNVLKGAVSTISKWHPIIMAELVDEFLNRFGTTFREPFEWMATYGYEAFWLAENGLVKLDISARSIRSPSGNYFFLPHGVYP